uniref:Uncharacterized protein n=1 Tax=Panagrolaimus sp. ES5 TaxID=591445 RepID=A0AC34GV52_9BILA
MYTKFLILTLLFYFVLGFAATIIATFEYDACTRMESSVKSNVEETDFNDLDTFIVTWNDEYCAAMKDQSVMESPEKSTVIETTKN